MKQSRIFLWTLLLIFASCGTSPKETEEAEKEETSTQSFMKKLSELCGSQINGTVFVHQRPEMMGTEVVFDFEKCPEDEIRILVEMSGEERTTIILTLMEDEILLKHDVRATDMLPASLTMYGGFSSPEGNASKQVFPIHNFGREMWPGFADYAWEICFSPDGDLEYMEIKEDDIIKHFIFKLPDHQ